MSHQAPKDHVQFGYHLILDGYECDPEALGNMEICYDVLNNIAKLGDMHKFHEPYLVKAESNMHTPTGKDPGGFSGFVMIYESHISLHTFTKKGFFTADVYSCKPFDHEVVIKYIKEVFKPKDLDSLRIDRGLKFPVHNIYK